LILLAYYITRRLDNDPNFHPASWENSIRTHLHITQDEYGLPVV